ncbi:MAG TPA: hypothetical protein VGO91_05130 [Pyrinomonadaceae bacterium]|jgi:hypothetical protein|nr:hypothetical protein [Pyrinomonadaceae bacterium]
MKKGVTLRAALRVGTDAASAVVRAQRKLEAAFARANPDLKMSVLGQRASGGVLVLKLYIEGQQAAPLDFVAKASEALRLAVEKVQPASLAFNVGPGTGPAFGPAIDVVENEDENEGLYSPQPGREARGARASITGKQKKSAPRRKKKLSGKTRPVMPPSTFHDCPLSGSGGDRPLNEIKNRTDMARHWRDTSIESLKELDWPQTINEKDRPNWSSSDMEAVKQNEGLPIRIQGWLAAAKKEGEESCNCNSQKDVDYHLWIVDDKSKADEDHRGESVVCEVTPRIRALHTGWDIKLIGKVVQSLTKVRLSGWLLMDQHHAEQLGEFRATLWEIHPIMEFEVQRGGKWVTLDDDVG